MGEVERLKLRLHRVVDGRFSNRARRGSSAALGVVVLAALLGACGSSPSAAPTTSSPKSAGVDQLKQNWAAFFSPATSPSRKEALLQNGASFAQVISAQSHSALAKGASATVSKVTVTSPTTAKVIYTVYLNGQPALKNQSGVAVLEGGTWKVGTSSFCALLALEQVHAAGCASH